MIRIYQVVAIVLAFLVIAHSTHSLAAIVASDSFESYSSNATLNANTGGTGFTGPYVIGGSLNANVNVISSPLSYSSGTVAVAGGAKAVRVSGIADNDQLISRPFAAQTGTLYVSFLYQASSTAEAFLQFGFSDVNAGEPKGSIGFQGQGGINSNAESFFVRVPNGSTTQGFTPTLLVAGQTYFVVGKFSKGTGSSTYNQVDMFLNPSSNVEPGLATATATSTINTGTGTYSNFILRSARTDSGSTNNFDALTIGTTFADVVPIPEPSILAWLIVPAVGLLWHRSRTTA